MISAIRNPSLQVEMESGIFVPPDILRHPCVAFLCVQASCHYPGVTAKAIIPTLFILTVHKALKYVSLVAKYTYKQTTILKKTVFRAQTAVFHFWNRKGTTKMTNLTKYYNKNADKTLTVTFTSLVTL